MSDSPEISPCPRCGCWPDPGLGEVHTADCPILTEPAAIVRELAERGPFFEIEEDGLTHACWTCALKVGVEQVPRLDGIATPANHEPSCLWRRAKALYPGLTPR